jgi:hypothetical protein
MIVGTAAEWACGKNDSRARLVMQIPGTIKRTTSHPESFTLLNMFAASGFP